MHLLGGSAVWFCSCGFCRHFKSDHGCQPCSLCDPVLAPLKNLIRNECRNANPDPLDDGRVLWCDHPNGPFPECPPLHPSLLHGSSCSKNCTVNFRSFAPGCACTVGCQGQPSHVVLCTDLLRWNSTTDVVELCGAVTVGPEDNETLALSHDGGATEDSVVLPIVMGSLVGIIITVIMVVIIGTCLYQRLRLKLCPPQHSASSALPLLTERRAAGSHTSSSEERIQMGSESRETHNGSSGSTGHGQSNGRAPVAPVDFTELREVNRETGQHPLVDTETGGLQQRETDEGEWSQKDSTEALKALLNSRRDLAEVTKRLDQSYAFDRVTWHDVAVHLLGWDHDLVHHTEYRCQQSLGGSPGDGPTFQVLQCAREQGKGLLDLIHCLRAKQCRDLHSQAGAEAEEILVNFWHKYMNRFWGESADIEL